MRRVAIVILNYLNYQDTIECIDSIRKLNYTLCGIVIVDNGSTNESCVKIKEKIREMKNAFLVEAKRNVGYAKGNNIGIKYARKKLDAEFVLVVNNDTVFIQPDYIERLLLEYQENIAVIGSQIELKDGIQLPCLGSYGFKNCVFQYLNMVSAQRGSCFNFEIDENTNDYMLHGAALLFTPEFFKWYSGFYPRTFLYGEENILYFMCKFKGLRQKYVSNAKIYHKEDKSSELSFGNDQGIVQKYMQQSWKYVIWWSLKGLLKGINTEKRHIS